MKIAYKKEHLNTSLLLGSVWLIFGLLGFNFNEEIRWNDYGYILFALCYIILYFYQKQNKYLTIQNEILQVNDLFGKKINLLEVKQIKKFAGDYILKTNHKSLTINTKIIDPKSLETLNSELEKLHVEWN
ncbi:hypothetical protein [Mariniflexile sp.]|uniref:hypothetical protein n=1 Tax=Mariniflexile sp. TaxID=1979402 RepID=UPI00356A3D25